MILQNYLYSNHNAKLYATYHHTISSLDMPYGLPVFSPFKLDTKLGSDKVALVVLMTYLIGT